MGKLYKIKHGSKVDDFEAMIQAIESEDTVIFESGEYFIPDSMQFEFGINVGFKGETDNPKDVRLNAKFLINEDAKFYMENMTIVTPNEDAGLTLKKKATCFFKNCVFESETERPIFHALGADVYLQKCVIRNNSNHKGTLYAENSATITSVQTSIDMAVITDRSQLNLNQSLIITSLIVKEASCFAEDYTVLLNYDPDTYGIVSEDISLVEFKKIICPEENLRIVVKEGALKIDELEFTNDNKISMEIDTRSIVVIEDRLITPEK
ncbi:hypothetical protein ACFQAV_07395 [Companilactobacillus huachuanensis]|uniref:DUF3737 family protein n=1 Tax=Companilactobacillus huachuanensis TaxID=2559914 RepID=A0ABW1RNN3_9LACO|nr:hypothetical protein [Companilactobacillus huachuanensis]